MRKIIVAEFVTFDGVVQAPGGADEDTDGGFIHGGWTWPYWHDDIGADFFEAVSQSDAFCWDGRRGRSTAALSIRCRRETRLAM